MRPRNHTRYDDKYRTVKLPVAPPRPCRRLSSSRSSFIPGRVERIRNLGCIGKTSRTHNTPNHHHQTKPTKPHNPPTTPGHAPPKATPVRLPGPPLPSPGASRHENAPPAPSPTTWRRLAERPGRESQVDKSPSSPVDLASKSTHSLHDPACQATWATWAIAMPGPPWHLEFMLPMAHIHTMNQSAPWTLVPWSQRRLGLDADWIHGEPSPEPTLDPCWPRHPARRVHRRSGISVGSMMPGTTWNHAASAIPGTHLIHPPRPMRPTANTPAWLHDHLATNPAPPPCRPLRLGALVPTTAWSRAALAPRHHLTYKSSSQPILEPLPVGYPAAWPPLFSPFTLVPAVIAPPSCPAPCTP
jgi:hypothetical protein